MTSLIPLDYQASAIAASRNTTDVEAIKTKVVHVNLSSYTEVPKLRQLTKGGNKSRNLDGNHKPRQLTSTIVGRGQLKGLF